MLMVDARCVCDCASFAQSGTDAPTHSPPLRYLITQRQAPTQEDHFGCAGRRSRCTSPQDKELQVIPLRIRQGYRI